MNILFLYPTIGHYMYSTLKNICNQDQKISITVIYHDKKSIDKNSNELEEDNKIKYVGKSKLSKYEVLDIIIKLKPKIIYFPAWQDKDYLFAIKKYRDKNYDSINISGFDDIWHGNLRQIIGSYYFKLFHKKYVDYAWIAGKPQYSYAQRLGFNISNIINDIYSADTSTFSNKQKIKIYKRFLFVGRFVNEKGLDILLAAYNMLDNETQNKWKLHLIGAGSLKEEILNNKSQNIIIHDFMQKDELSNELSKGGICVIPSRKEQGNLRGHEMALEGFQLIDSSEVGS